ncbi:MAG: DUF1552 domain-containing protein, partial [Myxococcota bacterium]
MARLLRRSILGGLSLGAMSPLLGSLAKTLVTDAEAQGPAPKRFILLMAGNGWFVRDYETTVRSETDWDLPPVLAPLNAYREKVTVLERFHNPVDKGLHSNRLASTTFMPAPDEKKDLPGGISIDRFIAGQIGANDPFPSINLTHYERHPNRIPNFSANGAREPNPVHWDPVAAYADILGGIGGDGAAEVAQRLAEDRSLLDDVTDDIDRMRGRLGTDERPKIDQYLDNLRALETQLAGLASAGGAGCTPFTVNPQFSNREYMVGTCRHEVLEAHMNIIVSAMACGLTRVANLSLLGTISGTHSSFPGSGFNGSHHTACHDNNVDAIFNITRYQMELVGLLWERLRAVPEGSGTMADNSLVMWLNAGGGAHHNGVDRIPVLLLGDAGGTVRAGRYFSFPKNERSIADVFTTVATAVGAPTESF